jgi:hypothetical protein
MVSTPSEEGASSSSSGNDEDSSIGSNGSGEGSSNGDAATPRKSHHNKGDKGDKNGKGDKGGKGGSKKKGKASHNTPEETKAGEPPVNAYGNNDNDGNIVIVSISGV